MTTARDWAKAYARQARADMDTWRHLQTIRSIPECHRLLLLQMACEKLTKAHLCGQGVAAKDLQASHAWTAKNLPLIIKQQLGLSTVKLSNRKQLVRHAKLLAQEIELLAPAVKRGGKRPDNCEYLWEDETGRLHLPLDWTFAPSTMVVEPAGRTLPKLISDAIDRLM